MANGDTPLHSAVRSNVNNLDPIKSLLEHNASDINIANLEGQTALHLVMVDFEKKMWRGRRRMPHILKRFFLYDKLSLIDLLLEHGADVNAADANGNTILHILVVQRDTYVIKEFITGLILEHGADVNVTNVNGDTPLLTLIIKNHSRDGCYVELAACLLQHGADINAANIKGETSLLLAIQYELDFESEELIECLLEYGADDRVVNANGDTPFQILYQLDHSSTFGHMRAFIKKCQNINLINSKGETPLHLTVRNKKYCQVPLIKLFVEHGADVSKEDALGETAYQAYCRALSEDNNRRRDPMLEILLQSEEQQHMNSSLHVASLFHNVDSVHRLLRMGVDVNATGKFGFSPLFYALIAHEYKEDKIVDMRSTLKLLLDYGADVTHQFYHSNLPLVRSNSDHLFRAEPARDEVFARDEVCSIMDLATFGTRGMCRKDYRIIRYNLFRHLVKLLMLRQIPIESAPINFLLDVSKYDDCVVSGKPREIRYNLPISFELLEAWRSRCSDELDAMREIEIGESKITYLDLLLASAKETAIFVKNKVSVEAFHAKKGLFPMYQGMLDAKLAKALERKKLVENAATVLSDALKFGDPSNEFFLRTLSYCSNEDLIRIIE